MLNFEIVKSTEEFRKLSDEWDELLDKSSSDNIFLTWEWQFNWWQAFNETGELSIILVRDEDNRLLGIAPLYVEKRGFLKFIPFYELKFIGYGKEATSEYLDFICQHGREEEVMNKFFEIIYQTLRLLHLFVFSDMAEDSKCKQVMLGMEKIKSKALISDKRPFCPIIKISTDWDSYVKNLPKLMRRNLRSLRRKIEQNFSVEFEKNENLADGNGSFSNFQRLYSARRIEKKEKNKYYLENYKNFQENVARSMSDKKWLYLCFLYLNKEIAAAQYYFNYKKRLYFYQMGSDEKYSKYNVSQNLMGYVVENATKNDIKEVDLLRGEEWYKLRWANGLKKKNIILISNSLLGDFEIIYLKTRNACLSILKKLVPAKIKEEIEKKAYK